MDSTLNQLWAYNDWANRKIFTLFEGYGDKVPYSCQHLLSHIMNAQSTWYHRVINQKPIVGVWDDHDLETCKKMHAETSAGLKAVIDDGTQSEVINYSNSLNHAFQNSLQDILLQVLTHGAYHRGQIAQELRKNGLGPVNTDYITFVR